MALCVGDQLIVALTVIANSPHEIRIFVFVRSRPSILDSGFWIPFLLLFRRYSLLDVRMFEDNDSRFEIEFFFFFSFLLEFC